MTYIETILSEITAKVAAISVIGGYNTTTANVNVPDEVKFDGYPSYTIDYGDERGTDGAKSNYAGSFKNELDIEIVVYYKINDTEEFPITAATREITNSLEDLKKALGGGVSSVNSLLYNGVSKPIKVRKGDRYVPIKATQRWTAIYTQDRNDPSIPGCA